MTNGEFKAWFEGFSESIDGRPTIKQFEKIKEKIAMLDGSVAYHHWVDRYVYPVVRPLYSPTFLWNTTSAVASVCVDQSISDSEIVATNSPYLDGRKDAALVS